MVFGMAMGSRPTTALGMPESAVRATVRCMKRLTVELIPDSELGGYTARVPAIPTYGEGETEEEAIEDLKEALAAFVEAFGLDEIKARLNPPSSLRQLDMELEDLVRA